MYSVISVDYVHPLWSCCKHELFWSRHLERWQIFSWINEMHSWAFA